jgi:short-subunit dehydrogenase
MKAAQASVVLTGAAGGIGAPTARALAAAGARLLLVGRDGARLEALAAALGAAWLAADLTTPEGVAAVRRAAQERDANVLVNNAGIASFGRLASLDAAHLVGVIETNLVAPMLLTRALLPGLQRQREAAVINVGSVLGRLGLPGFSVYSAAKFGLRGFSEALRRELADTSVKVQYLGPRVTATGFNSAEVEAYNRATRTAADRPEAVAQALVALLESGRAERFLGFPEKLAVRLNGAAPAALDGAFERHRRALAPS